MYTFKAQAKSNAKRFLVQTAKVADFEKYLTQHEEQWGCWLDASGRPVAAALAESQNAFEAKVAKEAQTDEQLPEDDGPIVADPFGAFAVSQLAGDGSHKVTPAARPASSTGLRIQKDRPEQNGVRRQSSGSVGDRLWAIYDAAGADITLEQAKAAAIAAGLSPTSAAIALYNWRKFNGIAPKVGKKA